MDKRYVAVLVAFVIVVSSAIAIGYYKYQIEIVEPPITTTTTVTDTVAPGDFLIDQCIEDNHDDGVARTPENGFNIKLVDGITFAGEDFYSKASVATVTVILYEYASKKLEESVASGTETNGEFVSGEHLRYKASKTGYITYYGAFTVPYHETDVDTTHKLTILMVNDPTSWEQKAFYQNDTEIIDTGNATKTLGDYTTMLNLKFKNLNNYDDTGFITSHNFLRGLWHKAYFFVRKTGTGTQRVILESDWNVYTISADSDVYWYRPLNDVDLSRELAADGVNYISYGEYNVELQTDCSSVTSGDAITLTYGIVIYGDASWLDGHEVWGPSESQTVDTFVIYP